MLEIPETHVLARQINECCAGKTVTAVTAAHSPHKFAWYFGDPGHYSLRLSGRVLETAIAQGGMVEIHAGPMRLVLGDGTNIRYFAPGSTLPDKHQLLVEMQDGSCLLCSVQMYGGLWLFREGENDNPYYHAACEKPSVFSESFDKAYFDSLYKNASPKLSAKAFLATEQRIPGLGNGVLQDILFHAGLHPKRKIGELKENERKALYASVQNTLSAMTEHGGRSTEKDLYGRNGGYSEVLSKRTVGTGCPSCGSVIQKQAYMGGSIYFCPACQLL